MHALFEYFVQNDPRLVAITIGYCISIAVIVGIIIFLLRFSSLKPVQLTFLLLNVCALCFGVMFVWAVNTSNLQLAAVIWRLSAFDIGIACFYFHWSVLLTYRQEKLRWWVRLCYALGAVLFALDAIFPQWFAGAIPRLYLESYPQPYILYDATILYYAIVMAAGFLVLLTGYRTANLDLRRRLQYVILSSLYGFVIGSSTLLLVWGIPVDPIMSVTFSFYNIGLAYGMLRYQLMDIRIAFRRALLASVLVAAITGTIILANFLSGWLIEHVSGFQIWVIPFLTALVAYAVGHLFLAKSRETEEAKQEFIRVAAHNLRTPLTEIRFSVSLLKDKLAAASFPEQAEAQAIADRTLRSAGHLIEVTNVLLEVSDAMPTTLYTSGFDVEDTVQVIKKVAQNFESVMSRKELRFALTVPERLPRVMIRSYYFESILQVLLENAQLYTAKGGTVTLSARQDADRVIVSVTDSGIGIGKGDLPRVFEKFYRTSKAQSMSPDGIGLGLSMAKRILRQYGGSIWVESEGEGKGSMFSFSLPILPSQEEKKENHLRNP